MPKAKAAVAEPVTKPALQCAAPECSNTFTPKRSTAKYCGTTCRQRAARARRAAEAAAAVDEAAETAPGEGGAEHGLVKATRLELEKADAIDTVDGQIALQLARKLTDPDQTGFAGLAKELRAVLRDAIGAPPPTPTEGDSASDGDDLPDEVKAARRKRDAARQAAGQA